MINYIHTNYTIPEKYLSALFGYFGDLRRNVFSKGFLGQLSLSDSGLLPILIYVFQRSALYRHLARIGVFQWRL